MKKSRLMSGVHCQRVGERGTLCKHLFFSFTNLNIKTILLFFFEQKSLERESSLERDREIFYHYLDISYNIQYTKTILYMKKSYCTF